jgi:hypothetical protein
MRARRRASVRPAPAGDGTASRSAEILAEPAGAGLARGRLAHGRGGVAR